MMDLQYNISKHCKIILVLTTHYTTENTWEVVGPKTGLDAVCRPHVVLTDVSYSPNEFSNYAQCVAK
jgi:hypothetical protein